MRLIDADVLLTDFVRYVRTKPHMHYGGWDKMCISGTEIDDVVTNATTIDAELVRHGRWICPDFDFSDYWKCSACNEEFYFEYDPLKDYEYHYCPNCGAKMDGGSNDGTEKERAKNLL